MKHFFQNILLSLLLLSGLAEVKSQVVCDITIDNPPPVCPNTDFQLSVPDQENCIYNWQIENETESLGKRNSLIIRIPDTTSFVVTVKDTLTQEECVSSPFVVEVYPQINIDFNQVQLTCTNGDNDNGNTAQIKATASGAFPPSAYHYFWHVHPLQIAPNDSSLAIGLKAHLNYVIEVKDNYGCYTTDTFYTKAYYNAEIEIEADPDTAYIERPHIEFSFENLSADSISITNHFWEFGDESPSSDLDTPIHTFNEEGQYFVVLTAYNQQGCDTTYVKPVTIEPIKLFIPNVFTPNEGDNINNYFVIRADDSPSGGDENPDDGTFKSFEETNPDSKPLNFYYESTNLIVFNRWGNKVYESSNYNNDWDGGNLSDGTYFYILKCHGYKNDYTYKGSVAIFRGGNQ